MSNPLFDQNAWYSIKWPLGTYLTSADQLYAHYDGFDYGSAFLSPINQSDPIHPHTWQLFPSSENASQYIIRPQSTASPALLSAYQEKVYDENACNDQCSTTTIGVTDKPDAATVWTVHPAENSYCFLSNNANGSDWYIAVDVDGGGPGSWLNLASSGGNKSNMSFEFSKVKPIDNTAFSTPPPQSTSISSTPLSEVITSQTTTSQPQNITSSAPGPPPTPKHTGASAGTIVGAVLGAVATLILTLIAVMWYLRRRKGRQQSITRPRSDDMKEVMNAFPRSNRHVEAPQANQIFEAPCFDHVHEVTSSPRAASSNAEEEIIENVMHSEVDSGVGSVR